MSTNANEFKHESYQDSNTIVDYLKSIIDGIEKGTISMGNDKMKIDLKPQGLLKMKIEAKRKTTSSKLNIQVSWKDNPKTKTTKIHKLEIT